MIELIPYMLILAWSVPGQPGRVEVERVNQLFADAEQCERAATGFVASLRRDGVTHVCMPVPGSEEFDTLFRQLDAEADKARREAGE
ncbi:hypothetical protein [Sphingomonas ursincola]|uniref:hypothetical protein n=1 Tax=Sphingomonas ursincola TaxID=56361 RepID=UPI0023531019|nr:hypothetical protein [Sphingomonas ursincola]MBY0619380.1 hypothetical protein [Sphingomonas ursincola]